MNDKIQQLVSDLPEIYQNIYGHPEWTQDVKRNCYDRIKIINTVYDILSAKINRPLRVLDLGCAQGFFCLSLAERGAIVTGIDFQEQNIAVCRALAAENTHLNVSFNIGLIEDYINDLEPNQYDLVIGLSVFHHIVHSNGVTLAQSLISRIISHTEVMIVELALHDEPSYWGSYQPIDSRELLRNCSFFHEIARFDTHISTVHRPIYVVSNRWLLLDKYCELIEYWHDRPYTEAQGAHNGSRRYYFGEKYFCKIVNFNLKDNTLSEIENHRNKIEIQRECAFLSNPPAEFIAPALIGYNIKDDEGWLIVNRLEGELLKNKLMQGDNLDKSRIVDDLLEQLTILEQSGLYHDDLRKWNVFINQEGKAQLIDFGSINTKKNDCIWPYDVFQSWFIFINELFNPSNTKINSFYSFIVNPFNLPEPFRRWLIIAWNQPAYNLSFAKLRSLFKQREYLPNIMNKDTGVERWLATLELRLQKIQQYQYDKEKIAFSAGNHNFNVEDVLQRIKTLEKQISEHIKLDLYSTDQLTAILNSRSWRLTAPYRYIGSRYCLLYQNIIKNIRYFFSLIFISCYKYICQCAVFKLLVIKMLHISRYYLKMHNLLKYLSPIFYSKVLKNYKTTQDCQLARLSSQLNNLSDLPNKVRNIYYKLKNIRHN